MSLYNTTLDQPFVFAAFVYLGLLAGGLHTLFSAVGRVFSGKKWVAAVREVVFVLAVGVSFFLAADCLTALRLRYFHFLGTAVGFLLYRAAVRPIGIWLNCKFRKKKIDNSRGK